MIIKVFKVYVTNLADELHLKLSTTICWFLHNLLATNSDVSTAVAIHIKKSPHLQQLFLNLSLCYTNNLKSNPEKVR